jgi:hypothetical protein
MAIQGGLSPTISIPNATDLAFLDFKMSVDTQEFLVTWVMRTNAANGNQPVCDGSMAIRNGSCSTLARQGAPGTTSINDVNRYVIQGSRTVATGYTDMMAAYLGAANNKTAQMTALMNHMYSAGHVNANLALTSPTVT